MAYSSKRPCIEIDDDCESVQSMAMSLPETELKFVDTLLGVTTATTGGVVNPNIVVVPQDGSENGRIGRFVRIQSILLRGSVALPSQATVADATDNIRIMLILDQQANGAPFTVANLLQQTDWLGMKNLDNGDRFKVLSDRTISINQDGGVATATFAQSRAFNLYLECNLRIDYDSSAATGAIGTQRSNSIAVVCISEKGHATLTYRARIRYTDE